LFPIGTLRWTPNAPLNWSRLGDEGRPMATQPLDLDELLTAAEVARALRVKPSTVYEAAAHGRIPCIRLWQGKRRALVRFRRQDIETWMNRELRKGNGH